MTPRALPLPLAAIVSFALSGCATPPVVHSEAQVDSVALGCGLAPGELVQGAGEPRLLLMVRRNASTEQHACVSRWAHRNGLKPVFADMQLPQAAPNQGCRMISLLAAASLTFTLEKVDPTYLPAINMNGTVQRVVALTIVGQPDLLPPLEQTVETEGWKARRADERCVEVDPAGHSLDEVSALSFRVNNGEFGDLKLNIIMRPDRKPGR